MLEQLHKAAQYLAAANISYLPAKPDDSHTNLEWNPNDKRLLSREFGTGNLQLGLNYKNFSLEILNAGGVVNTLELNGKGHGDIMAWIKSELVNQGHNDTYAYSFHYDLPYDEINNDTVYTLTSAGEMADIAGRLTLALEGFSEFLTENQLESEVRVWPHHFDLGFYTEINNGKSLFMGGGLAVPDSLVDDLYYYTTGWKSGQSVETKTYGDRKNGVWREDWNGGVLPSSNAGVNVLKSFLNESLNVFNVNN